MYIAPGYHYYDASHIVNAGVRSIKFSPGCSGLCDSGRELLVFTEVSCGVSIFEVFNGRDLVSGLLTGASST